jgi:O-antigen/teichoic acid export membrane protein
MEATRRRWTGLRLGMSIRELPVRIRSARATAVLARPLLRQAGIYTASNLAGKAIPFLLLPVLTRFMSPTDYGIVSMFLFSAVILDPFVSLGFAGAVTVKFYDRSTDLPAYLGTGTILTVALALPIELLVFLLRGPLSDLTEVPPEWLLLVVPLIVARAVGTVVITLLRLREKALIFGLVQNLQSVGLITLSLVFVVALGREWRGRLEAELIAGFTFAIVGLVALRLSRWLKPAFVLPYARHIVRFGVPLIPHLIGGILMVQTDRILLTNLVGVSETGLYTVGYQLALLVDLVAVSFNNAYVPWLFRTLTDADDRTRRRLVRFTYFQWAGMAALAAAVAFVMPWVAGRLLDHSFANSGRYVVWFAIGFLFNGMYYMVTNYIFYTQKTGWLAAVTITVALINIPLTYALIKINGGIGAAQGTAIALGLSFLFTWIVSQRVYPMPWFGGRTKAAAPDVNGGRP